MREKICNKKGEGSKGGFFWVLLFRFFFWGFIYSAVFLVSLMSALRASFLLFVVVVNQDVEFLELVEQLAPGVKHLEGIVLNVLVFVFGHVDHVVSHFLQLSQHLAPGMEYLQVCEFDGVRIVFRHVVQVLNQLGQLLQEFLAKSSLLFCLSSCLLCLESSLRFLFCQLLCLGFLLLGLDVSLVVLDPLLEVLDAAFPQRSCPRLPPGRERLPRPSPESW